MMAAMRRWLTASSLVLSPLFLSVIASSALAQPAPKAPPTPPPQAPAQAAPAQLPPEPEVTDPMLEPVPRPKVEVGTWQQALQLIKARSTDLRIAADEIARAEAQ